MNPNKCAVCLQAAVVLPEHERFVIQLCADFQKQIFPEGSKHDDKLSYITGSDVPFCSRCRVNLVKFSKLNSKLMALVCKTKEPSHNDKIRVICNLYRSPLKTGEETEERIHQDRLWTDHSDDQHSEILRQPLLNKNFVEGIKEDVKSPEKCQFKSSTVYKWPAKHLTLPESSSVVKRLSELDFMYLGKYPFQGTEFGFKCGSCSAICKFSTSKTSALWFNIVVHIGKWHVGEDKIRTYKTVQKCIQVAPNRFQYGKYSFEKIHGKYQCGDCGTLKHARAHKDKTKYILKHILEEHEHPSRTYVCEYCGVVYNRQYSLRLHKITKHEQPNVHFPCNDCDKIFMTRGGALLHQNRIHRKIDKHVDFICEICGKKCWSKVILKDHVAFVHNGQKMKCKDCGKMFASKLSLLTHRRSHNGKKYTCDICGMDFTQHYSVTRHKKTAHGA